MDIKLLVGIALLFMGYGITYRNLLDPNFHKARRIYKDNLLLLVGIFLLIAGTIEILYDQLIN